MLNGIRRLFKYRELLWVLTLRDLQVRYKQSVLGIIWVVLQPLAMMIIFTFVFSRLLDVGTLEDLPYPVFAYSGLMVWFFFSGALTRAIPSLESNAPLIKKVYFPREFLPMACVLSALIDLGITALIFLGLMLYYHIPFTPKMAYVVLILPVHIVFTLGVCLAASAVNAHYRDVKHALPLLLQLWFYATPIIYPVAMVPERYHTLFIMNPMTAILESYRNVLVRGLAPGFHTLMIALAGALVLFIISYIIFKRVEKNLADVV